MILGTAENIAVINLVVSGLLTVAVAYLGFKAREVAKLKDDLEEKTEACVNAKFDARDTQCKLQHEAIHQELGHMQKRLDKGDGAFDDLDSSEHRLELKLVAAIGDLKQSMLRECADRDDVKKLSQEVANLAGRFSAMERAVAMDIENARSGRI